MSHEDTAPWTAPEVVDLVRGALADSRPSHRASRARLYLDRARDLQRRFRAEPVGGKLAGLKKLFYWWTASSFDRQAKAIEALLDATAELVEVTDLRTQAPPRAPSPARPGPSGGGPPRMSGALEVLSEMLMPERVLLYSLVYGLKPDRCLEIGTFQGGSAALICAALDDSDRGRLVCVDPEPRILPEAWRWMGRATVVEGPSPDVLPRARAAADGPFDFALIDGDHSAEGVARDVGGVLEHLAAEAYLLFHDCHNVHVEAGIETVLRRHAELVDCGILSTTRNPVAETEPDGRPVVWGGLRLLRYRRGRER